MFFCAFYFFCSSRRRHTRCALVTGVQTCALPISGVAAVEAVQTAFDPQRFFRDAEEQGLKLVSGDEKNPLVLRGEPREMMALFSDGTILVSESHLHTPSVDSYISRARRSYQLRRQPVSLEVIGEAYRRLGAVSDKRRATGARTPRQAEAVSLIREAIEMDATDIHKIGRASCRERVCQYV